MASEVVMPQMGADMVEGTIVRWLKAEGDAVTRGEVIAEIETDKANVEIEAFDSGVFRKVIHGEGDTVAVGTVIAVIAGADESIASYDGATSNATAPTSPVQPAAASAPAEAPPPPLRPASAPAAPAAKDTGAGERPPVPPPPPEVPAPQPTTAQVAKADDRRLRVSPLAKRIAEERGVDLRTITGTGPDGRIVKRDVEGAPAASSGTAPSASPSPPGATAGAAASAPTVVQAPSKMRQAIARRMSQSKREAPHYYLLVDIDMTDAMALRAQVNPALPDEQRISVNDLIVRAAALALQAHPQFNATIDGETVTRHDAQHVCMAIALDDGLIAPAIVDAGRKSLREIAAASKDLVGRAKGGSLRANEITAGTFTITNLGAYGIETLIGIIQPPQTAILGAGSVAPAAAVREGAVVVRQLMKTALSADHRLTDGAEGARFLGEIKRLLESPALLLI